LLPHKKERTLTLKYPSAAGAAACACALLPATKDTSKMGNPQKSKRIRATQRQPKSGLRSVVPLVLNTCVIVLLTVSIVHWQGSTKTTPFRTTAAQNSVSESSSSTVPVWASTTTTTSTLQLSPALVRLLQDTKVTSSSNDDDDDDDTVEFDANAGDAPHIDDDATRTETCKQFLYKFLNGTTDARDECQGFYNAFKAADCEDDGHHTTLPVMPSSSASFAWTAQLRRNVLRWSAALRRNVVGSVGSSSSSSSSSSSVSRQHKLDNGTIVDDDVAIDDFFENWQCCDSIRSYYEKHCETGMGSELQSARLLGIMLVLLACTMMKAILKRCGMHWLPDACVFIMVGAMVGGILRLVNRRVIQDNLLSFDTGLFLQILLPPIIFQAALSIDKRAFRRDLFPILAFASVGTAFSAIAIGLITHHLSSWTRVGTLPLLDSLVFGSLISSIDPVATLGILSGVGVSQTDTLYTLIFGESLLNDGVAIVLFDTLKLHLGGDDIVLDKSMYHQLVKHFVLMLLGSISIGIVSGMACTIYFWALRGQQSAVTEVMIFFCWALIPYYIADGVQCSGIISIMVMGFFLDYYVIGGFQSEESAWMDYMQMRNGQIHTSTSNLHNSSNNNNVDSTAPPERPATTGYAGPHQYPHLQHHHFLPSGFGNTQYPSSSPSLNDRITTCYTSLSHAFSGRGHILSRSRHHVGFVAHVIANLMDTAIFAYLGLFLFNETGWNIRLNLIAIFGCVSSRAVMVVVLSLFINMAVFLDFENMLSRLCKTCRRSVSALSVQPTLQSSSSGNLQGQQQRHPFFTVDSNGITVENADIDDDDDDSLTDTARAYLDRRTQVILLLSGIRGAVSFALVENIPIWDTVSKTGSKFKPELKAMTSSSIFFTLFVFGALTYFTVQRQDRHPASRGAGPLTDRLLSEPLDSGDEAESDDQSDSVTATGGATTNTAASLEIEQSRYRPPGMADSKDDYRPLTTN
jgi:NhaP-type Na+/H+ or K+/H+ antiporter